MIRFSMALSLSLFFAGLSYSQQQVGVPSVSAPDPISIVTGSVLSGVADGEYECRLTFSEGDTLTFGALVIDGFVVSELPSSVRWPADTDLAVELFEFETGTFAGYGLLASNSGSGYGANRPIRLWPIVLTDERRTHILDGDPVGNGGGHGMGRGKPGKSEFTVPDDRAIDIIINVATDPSLTWIKQNNGRIRIEGYSFPHFVEVILEADGKTIVTGYPTDVPRNPNN